MLAQPLNPCLPIHSTHGSRDHEFGQLSQHASDVLQLDAIEPDLLSSTETQPSCTGLSKYELQVQPVLMALISLHFHEQPLEAR